MIDRRLLVVCVLLASCVSPLGREAASAGGVLDTEDGIRAASLASDAGELDRLVADELTLSHAGIRQTKDDWIAAIRSGDLRYHTIEHSARQVRLHGDVALVTGYRNLRITWDGRELAPRLQYTAVYLLRGGDWRLIAYHSDERREPPAP